MSAVQPHHDPRPILAAYGDSLVEGWGLSTQDGLIARLEEGFVTAGCEVKVLNFGVSGDTSVDGLERLPEVLAAKPSAVLLEFGANDCYQGLPVEETLDALDKMIVGLRAENIAVFLAGWRTRADLFKPVFDDPELAALVPLPPPFFNPVYVDRFNQVHGHLAKKHSLPFVPHILDPLTGQKGCLQADGVHPSAKGVRILTENLVPLLLPLFAS